MYSSKKLFKIATAVLLPAFAGACAHNPAGPETGIVLPSASIFKSQLAASQAEAVSQAAGHDAVQAPGFVVHIDPLTGQILPKASAAPGQEPLQAQQLHSAPVSEPEPVATPSPVPGGGVRVKLNRQFHQPLVATIAADGKIRLQHRPQHSESD
jgi:hypothetical protein